MSWETPAGGNDWGTGDTAVVSGDGEWDDSPATGSSEHHAADEFNDDAGNDHGGYGGGEENGGGGGGRSGGCFNCGEEGHSKAECTQPAKARPCYNCGEEGHTKAECTNPAVAREFTGTCRICEQSGHRASECPSAPPKLCNNCKEEGHSILECKNPRKIERNDVEDVAAEVAWENLIKQSQEGDFDDMKDEIMKYIKASPDATYTYTNMDLQGNLDRKFSVSWRKSSKHSRPKEKESWPATPEENLERLANAGEPVDRGIPLCSRCNELGHTVKHCTEERVEVAIVFVIAQFLVRISSLVATARSLVIVSKECPEPRSAEGVECKNCNEIGHFSRDCPTGGGGDGGLCRNCNQPGHRAKDCTNERVMICRNCDAEGHTGKECPKPRDYSRVQCQNCKQMGHTKVRCKEPIAEEDAGDVNGYGGGDATADSGDYGGGDAANDDYSAPAAGGDDHNWATGGGQEAAGDGGW
ncbi:uncharacterized protein EAF02_005378 [Botrytis sinoallii]|uniref:uncharacterized protein n=1 Tax=Botrytis sinoallii TaxID=1463999 RepID=UPI001900AC34|nr:uncharacterized protein EAF02_005378 [Botrytis sinoallii]KAF7883458.1 hypothetical protein EAF02_005378 [Botrytis sinoallii]